MGSSATAKIIPMTSKQIDAEAVAALAAAETPAVQAAADAPPPAALDLPVPETEPIPTVSLTKVFRSLLAQITRERIITAGLACLSLGALFLVWYLGTKYR